MKKVILAILVVLIMIPFGCSKKEDTGVIAVGISQIVEHPALDATQKGIIDRLAELGYTEGENITYDVQIAQGNIATANQIAKNFVGDQKDIIIGIATPTAVAAANATKDIPIVFSAVTDPVSAGLVKSIEMPGGNVTGTSDLTPVGKQLELLSEMGVELKNVGVIYNAGEQNSLTLVNLVKQAGEEQGFGVVEATVSNSSGVLMAARSLVGKVQAIYVPTDNTVVSALESVIQVANDSKLPLITGDTDSVERGALASLGFNYYKHGRQTADIVAKIIEGAKPADIPVEFQQDLELFVNLNAAEKMGVTVPESMISEAQKVIK